MRRPTPLAFWLGIACAIRAVSAATHSAWGHPDEWFQTAEFANLIANGIMSHTQEVGLHMRNLSWPSLLALPLAAARWLDPDWVGLRVLLVQLAAAAASLLLPWGVDRSLRASGTTDRARHLALMLVVLPAFTVAESVRPGQENLASAALWASLGCLAAGRPMAAGFLAVGIAAFKYPAGLLSAGIALGVAWRAWRAREPRELVRFAAGAGAGLVAWGIPDWIFYGRPWESLWMYSQYNVFTGLGTERFGAQTPGEFLTYFRGHWGGPLLPVAAACVPLAAYGFARGLRRAEPWALGLLLYLGGHLAVGHKEPRFMAPIEALVLWAAVVGGRAAWPALATRIGSGRWLRRTAAAAAAVLLAWNGLLALRAAWGETWVATGTYFEINRHLATAPKTCAVISVRKPLSIHLPWRDPAAAPSPALGFFPSERRQPSFAQASSRPVIWIERAPSCKEGQPILLQVHKPDPGWRSLGCSMLRSGILNVLPERHWDRAIDRGLASGTWYSCPSSALAAFSRQETRRVLARALGRIERLPPLGVGGEELAALGRGPEHAALADGTLGDW